MRVVSLQLRQFRNIKEVFLDCHPEINVIYGENAQGKTNLLESMVYLSTGKTHRAMAEKELIQFSQNFAQLDGKIDSFQREYQLHTSLSLGKRRKLTRNGVTASGIKEFSEVFQTVLFCPEDLILVRAGSLTRRRFLDTAISQLRPTYSKAISEYKKLYQHKSRILKEKKPDFIATLPDFNLRMLQTGTLIIHYRAHFIKRLQERVPAIHEEFAGGRERISLEYKTVSTVTDPLAGEEAIFRELVAHQESHLQAELASGQCLTGPHKDDLLLFLGDLPAKQFASQGQTRTFALSLKLGEREIFFEETGEYPVLLLDDVLSELDASRQEFVLSRIQSGQVFITSCEGDHFFGQQKGAIFKVKQGDIVSSDPSVESI